MMLGAGVATPQKTSKPPVPDCWSMVDQHSQRFSFIIARQDNPVEEQPFPETPRRPVRGWDPTGASLYFLKAYPFSFAVHIESKLNHGSSSVRCPVFRFLEFCKLPSDTCFGLFLVVFGCFCSA